MNKKQWIWVIVSVMIVALSGCGNSGTGSAVEPKADDIGKGPSVKQVMADLDPAQNEGENSITKIYIAVEDGKPADLTGMPSITVQDEVPTITGLQLKDVIVEAGKNDLQTCSLTASFKINYVGFDTQETVVAYLKYYEDPETKEWVKSSLKTDKSLTDPDGFVYYVAVPSAKFEDQDLKGLFKKYWKTNPEDVVSVEGQNINSINSAYKKAELIITWKNGKREKANFSLRYLKPSKSLPTTWQIIGQEDEFSPVQ